MARSSMIFKMTILAMSIMVLLTNKAAFAASPLLKTQLLSSGQPAAGPMGIINTPDSSPMPDSIIQGEYLVKFKPYAEARACSATLNAACTSSTTTVPTLIPLEKRFNFNGMIRVQEDVHDAITKKLKNLRANLAVKSTARNERLRKRLETLQGQSLHEKRGRVYKLNFTVDRENHEELLKLLKKNPDIEWVQPNHLYRVNSTTPNDPYYTSLIYLQTINAPAAWDITTGSDAVTVAVIDCGVDWTHPDLADNIWANLDDIPGDGIDNDGNGFIDDVRGWDFVNVDQSVVFPGEDYGPPDNDPMDFLGHGTHVAGIIAGRGNNGIGITGVNWHTKIMPLRAGYESTNGLGYLTDDAIVGALHYAALNGADIINMSFGSPYSHSYMHDGIKFAYDAGCLLIAGAGNDASPLQFYPAGWNEVISVGAVNKNVRTFFSNFGANVDIVAPGYSILSTFPNNNYKSLSGTSMASPVVAGVAALVIAAHPDWTREQVAHQLLSTASDVDAANPGMEGMLGAGLIDAVHAVGPAFIEHRLSISTVMTMDPQGDNDGIMEPGESIDLLLSIRNFSLSNQYAAVVSTVDPYVQVVKGNAEYGTIPEGISVTNSASPFSFKIAPNVPQDYCAVFNVEIYCGESKVKTQSVSIDRIACKWGGDHLISHDIMNDACAVFLPDGRLFMCGTTYSPPHSPVLAIFRGNDGTWEDPVRINPESQTAYGFSAAIDESMNIYIAYVGVATEWPDCEIFLRKYNAVTKTWGAVSQITSGANPKPSSDMLGIASEPGGNILAVWADDSSGATSLYSQRFDGLSWGTKTALHAPTVLGTKMQCMAMKAGTPVLLYTVGDIDYKREGNGRDWGPEITMGPTCSRAGIPFAKGSAIFRLNHIQGTTTAILEMLQGSLWQPSQNLFDDTFMGAGNSWYSNMTALSLFDVNTMDYVSTVGGPFDPLVGILQIKSFFGKEQRNGVWGKFRTYDDFCQNFDFPQQGALTNDGLNYSYLSICKRNSMYNGTWIYRTTEPVASSHIPAKPVITILKNTPTSTSALVTFDIASSHPQGIREFEYAVGTLPGRNDLLDWTFSAASGNVVQLDRSNIPKNQEFFISARAHSRGIYSSAMSISTPITVPDVLPPHIQVSPASIAGTVLTGDNTVANLTIGNAGTLDLSASLATVTTDNGSWLSVNPTAITVAGSGSATINVRLDAATLARGNYSGEIRISHNDPATASPLIVPVAFTVANRPPRSGSITVNPNPVTGPTAQIVMTGATDDGGEANLTYTWSTTGTPPAPVSFSINGTNAAKTTTATFTQIGAYSLQCTVKDIENLSAASSISFVVTQLGTPVTFEAENLTLSGRPGTSVVTGQAGASNNAYAQISGTPAVGSYIQMIVPNIAAATYAITMYYKSNANRGLIQCKVDGTDLGSICDEYAATVTQQVRFDLGNIVLLAGNHTLRFSVTGKNTRSSGYTVVIDKIVLTPVGSVTQYTITASAGANGSISPSGEVSVASGASKTFTITANSGYAVGSVTVDGTNQGAPTSYTFSNVTANHSISATFIIAAQKLSGTSFGTSPAWNNSNSTFDKAFDGNTATFFDYTNGNGGYTGIDLGSSMATVTKIRFFPRSGFEGRMTGGKFQGSNTSTGSGFADIYTIPSTPSAAWQEVAISNSASYRYLRYLSPSNGFCNVAEIEFYGNQSAPLQYTITASADANGSISPTGNVVVNSGSNLTFTITANSGYAVGSVTVDGTNQGAPTSYTFSNVTANHTIAAAFQSASTFPNPSKWYRIATKIGTASGLNISGGTYANNQPMIIWTYGGGANEQWKFNDEGNGYYSIRPRGNTSYAIEVPNGNYANGQVIDIYTFTTGANQQFKVVNNGGGYYLLTCKGNNGFNIANGGSATNGTKPNVWQNVASDNNQNWVITEAP